MNTALHTRLCVYEDPPLQKALRCTTTPLNVLWYQAPSRLQGVNYSKEHTTKNMARKQAFGIT